MKWIKLDSNTFAFKEYRICKEYVGSPHWILADILNIKTRFPVGYSSKYNVTGSTAEEAMKKAEAIVSKKENNFNGKHVIQDRHGVIRCVGSSPISVNEFRFSPNNTVKDEFFEHLGALNNLKVIDSLSGWQIDFDIHVGYMLTKQNVYLAGIQAPLFEHEISHMVEMNVSERWLMDDWGLPEREFSARGIIASAARESRVRAIETYLRKDAGPWMDKVPLLKLHSSFNSKFVQPIFSASKFKDITQFYEWITSIYFSAKKKWSYDRIVHEWKVRAEYVNNWMETKELT